MNEELNIDSSISELLDLPISIAIEYINKHWRYGRNYHESVILFDINWNIICFNTWDDDNFTMFHLADEYNWNIYINGKEKNIKAPHITHNYFNNLRELWLIN